ncbi:hypothetical protein GGF32_005968 [Allomyces javanicus]|nr:hypothetical protein GGF32_005968 [Allomyces javanicus]
MLTFSSSLIEPVFSILAGRRSPPPPPPTATTTTTTTTTDARPVPLPGEFIEWVSPSPSPSPPRGNYGVRVTDLRTPTAAGGLHLARRDSALTMAAAPDQATNAAAATTKALEYRAYDLERRAASLTHQLAAEKAMTQMLDAKLRAADARLALAHDDSAAANALYATLRHKHAAQMQKENRAPAREDAGDDTRAIEMEVAALQSIHVGLKHELDAAKDRIAQMQAAGEALQQHATAVTAERDALKAVIDGHGVRERDGMIAQLQEYIALVARVVVQGQDAPGLEALVRAGPPPQFIALLEQIVHLRDQVPPAAPGNGGDVLAQFVQMYAQTLVPAAAGANGVGVMPSPIPVANASAPTPNPPVPVPAQGMMPITGAPAAAQPAPPPPIVPIVAPSVPAPAPAPAPPPPVPVALIPPHAKRTLFLQQRGAAVHNFDVPMGNATPPPPPPPVGDAMDVSTPAPVVNEPLRTPLGRGWGAGRMPATPATDNKWLARPQVTPIAETRAPFGSAAPSPMASPLAHRLHGGGAGGALLRANAPGRHQQQPDTPRPPPGAGNGGFASPYRPKVRPHRSGGWKHS